MIDAELDLTLKDGIAYDPIEDWARDAKKRIQYTICGGVPMENTMKEMVDIFVEMVNRFETEIKRQKQRELENSLS